MSTKQGNTQRKQGSVRAGRQPGSRAQSTGGSQTGQGARSLPLAENKSGAANTSRQASAQPSRQAGGKAAQSTATAPIAPPLIGSRVRNDLAGAAVALLAVVLLVVVLVPTEAVAARFVADALRSAFGVGAVILPLLLLGWSATFFVKQRLTNSPVRLALGLGVIYLALISLIGTTAPLSNAELFFSQPVVAQHGGYLGGALAWVLLSFLGTTISLVVLIGLVLIGLILIGLSVTGLVDWAIHAIKNRGNKLDQHFTPLAEQQPLADVARRSAYQLSPVAPGMVDPRQGGSAGSGNGGSAGPASPALAQAATQLMQAAQLENTLHYPAQAHWNEDDVMLDEPALGATRRRMAEAHAGAAGNIMSGAAGGQGGFAGGALGGAADGAFVGAAGGVFAGGRAGGAADGTAGRAAARASFGQLAGGQDNRALNGASAHRAEEALHQGETQLLAAEGPRQAHSKSGRGAKASRKTGSGAATAVSPDLHTTTYTLPSMRLLRVSREKASTKAGVSELRATANRLQDTLEEFKVEGEVVGWIAGPTVTLYKISLGEGVRLNRVTALQSDIQLSLAAQAVRIVAPIPGTSLVGIEVPNQDRNEVLLGDVLDSSNDATLALAIGKDVEGTPIVADLGSMPHLLIGGTTGSGKSVAINSIIMSLLMRTTPEQVRMIMIDPKRVELTLYNGIPHLYVPVVTDAGQAASALSWCVAEMDRRLKLFEKHAVKNIRQFNARASENMARLINEREREEAAAARAAAQSGKDDDADDAARFADGADGADNTQAADELATQRIHEELDITVLQEQLRATLPYLVIVIDELADLMMLNGKEVEGAISRLAQLARAAGLHLVVATQRPSTNVITGLIKANIVNRIAFTVASSIDSRVILDTPGAEDLIGLGDLLFSRPEYSKPVRIQGCFVSEPEIETVVEYWRSQGETDYHEEILTASAGGGGGSTGFGDDFMDDDPLLWEAAEIVVSSQLGSTSTLQRRLKVGYARAGRIMDMLEMKGVVGPPNGSKPREVLLDDVLDIETLRAFG